MVKGHKDIKLICNTYTLPTQWHLVATVLKQQDSRVPLVSTKQLFTVTGVGRVNGRRHRPFIHVDNNENFDYSPVDYNGDNNDYGDYGYDYNDADGLVAISRFLQLGTIRLTNYSLSVFP